MPSSSTPWSCFTIILHSRQISCRLTNNAGLWCNLKSGLEVWTFSPCEDLTFCGWKLFVRFSLTWQWDDQVDGVKKPATPDIVQFTHLIASLQMYFGGKSAFGLLDRQGAKLRRMITPFLCLFVFFFFFFWAEVYQECQLLKWDMNVPPFLTGSGVAASARRRGWTRAGSPCSPPHWLSTGWCAGGSSGASGVTQPSIIRSWCKRRS